MLKRMQWQIGEYYWPRDSYVKIGGKSCFNTFHDDVIQELLFPHPLQNNGQVASEFISHALEINNLHPHHAYGLL